MSYKLRNTTLGSKKSDTVFIFSSRQSFRKTSKIIEEQGKEQVEVLEVLKPKTQKLTIKDVIPKNTLS